jgi:hypothetical protein
MVIDWNQTALRATEIAAVPVPVQARAMAMVHAAIFDAVNAIERKYAIYAIDVGAKPGALPEAAAAAAAQARSPKSCSRCARMTVLRLRPPTALAQEREFSQSEPLDLGRAIGDACQGAGKCGIGDRLLRWIESLQHCMAGIAQQHRANE